MERRELPFLLGAIVVVGIDYWISGRLKLDSVVWKAVVGGIMGQTIFAAIQKTVDFLGEHHLPRKKTR